MKPGERIAPRMVNGRVLIYCSFFFFTIIFLEYFSHYLFSRIEF